MAAFENAKTNLRRLGKEINIKGLEFDEDCTCILGVSNFGYSVHITYVSDKKRVFLYSHILSKIPEDEKVKTRLYERILEGSVLSRDLNGLKGAGVGLAKNEGLVLLHSSVKMEHAVPTALWDSFRAHVVAVDKWRGFCKEICGELDDTS